MIALGTARALLQVIWPFEADGIAIHTDCYRRKAIGGGAEAAAGFEVELPAVAGALENGIPERSLGKRPEGVGTFVVKREDFVVGAYNDELCAGVFDLKKRIGPNTG